MQWERNNRHIVYCPGPPQWAFDCDCRWLWLDSLFCLCPLVQDHIHDMGVPPDPLPPLLRLLLLQWANVCAAGAARLLGRPHLAHGHQIPAGQCTNHHFWMFHCFHLTSNGPIFIFLFIFFKFWQDIVEDERSDKEETESEDEDDEHEQREKSKNGHVQNGHTVLNNNHRKTD